MFAFSSRDNRILFLCLAIVLFKLTYGNLMHSRTKNHDLMCADQ